jgi:hypothetical protein
MQIIKKPVRSVGQRLTDATGRGGMEWIISRCWRAGGLEGWRAGWLAALLFSSLLCSALLCSTLLESWWTPRQPCSSYLLHRAPSNRLLVLDEMTVDPRGAL